MHDKYKKSVHITYTYLKLKMNIQQESQMQYLYIKVSSLVDSCGWSFDSKLQMKD